MRSEAVGDVYPEIKKPRVRRRSSGPRGQPPGFAAIRPTAFALEMPPLEIGSLRRATCAIPGRRSDLFLSFTHAVLSGIVPGCGRLPGW